MRIPEAVQISPEKLTPADTRSKGIKLRETDGSDEAGDEYEYSDASNSRSLSGSGDVGLVDDVVSLPAELWMEEEGGAAGVRSEAMDITKSTGDLRDFLEDALSSLEKLESQWTLESEVQDSLDDPNAPISEEDKVEDLTKQEEDLGPMRLRRRVHPPQRLTYDTLGESSEEPVSTARRSDPEVLLPAVNWVGNGSALASDTIGLNIRTALALSSLGIEITPEVCQLICES